MRRLWFLLQCASHSLVRLVAGLWKRLQLSRLGCAVWCWRAVVRYCLTGDCGLACGMATFGNMDNGTFFDLFVPEANCPIHDDFRLSRWTWWWQSAIERIKNAVSLARDVCETVYASYPDEAEDGFQRALEGDER